jgi:hypothetical protein
MASAKVLRNPEEYHPIARPRSGQIVGSSDARLLF